jgi:hypothetical protein
VTHPYRAKPAGERARTTPEAQLALTTVAFGLCCAILVEAMGGPACALAATVIGVALLLASGRR